MQTTLAGTALLMGLAAGPHCVAMCGAASAGVIRIVRGRSEPQAQPRLQAQLQLQLQPQPQPQPRCRPTAAAAAIGPPSSLPSSSSSPSPRVLPAALVFHLGRAASYATAGALAAASMRGLALAGGHVAALRPLWVMLHVFVLAWGLLLAATGRQPLWAHRLGQQAAARLRTARGGLGGVLAAGALWVAMPCGLLYSALMLAALGNGPLEGAMVMGLFAAGSALSLLVVPWIWQRLRAGPLPQQWGNRLAGLLLVLLALQALGLDLRHQIELWCS